MSTRVIKRWLLFVLILAGPLLMADIGPKPTADFEIDYQIAPPPQLTGYALFTCQEADCSDARQLQEGGPQHFTCTQEACESLAYGYGDYLYVQLDFDGVVTRVSNITAKEYFYSSFLITVNETDLILEETGGWTPKVKDYFSQTEEAKPPSDNSKPAPDPPADLNLQFDLTPLVLGLVGFILAVIILISIVVYFILKYFRNRERQQHHE